MQSPRIQLDMHRPNSWVSHELTTLKTLGLVLKSSMSITRPDPKLDEGLHVSSSGVHHGGTIKVIVVSVHHSQSQKVQANNAGWPPPNRHNEHEKSPRRTRLQKLLPPRRAPLPIHQPSPKRQNRQHQEYRPSTAKTRPPTPRPRGHSRSPRECLSPGPTGDVPGSQGRSYRTHISSSLAEIMARIWN